MSILRVQNLEKQYKRRKVVDDISMQINNNEIVGLLGPNGAGKTTCFYIIVGLIAANRGKIYLNNLDITSFAMHERAKLGISYLPQEASIFRKLSVADNIMAIIELRKDLNKHERQQLLDSLLHEFRIEHLGNNVGFSLSGGERRRVEIARSMALDPKLILLDEPFAGIDPLSVNDLKHLIRQLHKRGVSILITDHNVRETLDICHRAYIVNLGKIIATGTPELILQNEQVREVYLGHESDL